VVRLAVASGELPVATGKNGLVTPQAAALYYYTPEGRGQKEERADIDLLSRDDDFLDQALGDRLAIGKGEALQMVASQVPKVLDLLEHL
jgi:hypothetical protein